MRIDFDYSFFYIYFIYVLKSNLKIILPDRVIYDKITMSDRIIIINVYNLLINFRGKNSFGIVFDIKI